MLENLIQNAAQKVVKTSIKNYAHKSVDELIDKAEELIKNPKPVEVIKEESHEDIQARKFFSKIGMIACAIICVSSIVALCFYIHNTKFEHKNTIENIPGVAIKMFLMELL
jgi:hypothetical protein